MFVVSRDPVPNAAAIVPAEGIIIPGLVVPVICSLLSDYRLRITDYFQTEDRKMTTIANTKEAMAAAKTRMDKAIEDFRKELTSVRTGRANAAILDNVRVDYHGTPMPVNQLGNITVPDATTLLISPWDPSAVPLIDKAVRASDLGLNPNTDGKVVRIPIPTPTGERRKELVKQIHKALENHRTAVRNIRRDVKEAIDKLEKDKKISQDEHKRSLEELDKLSQAETKKIEDLSASKEKEVMEI
jgi:ribosome recycling factor